MAFTKTLIFPYFLKSFRYIVSTLITDIFKELYKCFNHKFHIFAFYTLRKLLIRMPGKIYWWSNASQKSNFKSTEATEVIDSKLLKSYQFIIGLIKTYHLQ